MCCPPATNEANLEIKSGVTKKSNAKIHERHSCQFSLLLCRTSLKSNTKEAWKTEIHTLENKLNTRCSSWWITITKFSIRNRSKCRTVWLKGEHFTNFILLTATLLAGLLVRSNFDCYFAGVFPATARPFIGYFMVTWHLTMKLFPAKSHERATLRKLWRQTGNSSLLPTKCWPLLHVITGISARFSNFAFVLFCYITNHLKCIWQIFFYLLD